MTEWEAMRRVWLCVGLVAVLFIVTGAEPMKAIVVAMVLGAGSMLATIALLWALELIERELR